MNLVEKLKKNPTDSLIVVLILIFFPLVYSVTFNQTTHVFHYPLGYGEDGVLTLAIFKGILQNGWYFENKYLAAPFIQLHYDFPIPDLFFILIIKIMGFFNANHFQIYNLFFYLSYPMVGISSFVVLRKLGASLQLSLLGSLTFTFLPYHQLRLNHLFLTNYFSVPIFIFYAFKCFESDNQKIKMFQLKPILLLVISAASGVYYAFFGGFFIFLAGLLSWKRDGNNFGLKKSIFYSIIILSTVIACVAPNIAWQIKNGKNPVIGKRTFTESEVYGLKIAQLVLPTQGHRFEPFAYLNRRYSSSAPNVNENAGSSLGLIATFGFLGLLLLLLKFKTTSRVEYLVSRLNISGILFATVGGGGLLFAFFLTPQFRGLNRISPFIAFFSIIYFCILAEHFLNKIKIRNIPKSSVQWLAAGVLIVFSTWDQLSLQHAPGIVHGYATFDSNEVFFKNLEKSLPPESMIYQLPYVRYPESPMAFKEGYYALLRPYLHSNTLKWSYGQMGYTKDDAWISTLSALPVEKQLSILKEFNFAGILIDRSGFKDNGVELENKISKLCKTEGLVSPDKKYSFFSIANFISSSLITNKSLGAFPVFHDDWYPSETDGKSKWLWSSSQQSKINFQTFNRKPTKCSIVFNLQASGPSKVTLKSTDLNFQQKTYDFTTVNNYNIVMDINIEATGTIVSFESDSKPLQIGTIDTRQFSFRIIDLSYCDQKF